MSPSSRSASAVLEFAPIRLLGLISYGVYIYHLPCLNLTARAMKLARFSASDHWIFFALAGLTLSITVASTSYVFIERPILQWVKRRPSGAGPEKDNLRDPCHAGRSFHTLARDGSGNAAARPPLHHS